MAITLTDGRGELYQWDTGRTLTVDDATVTQVHFQNRAYGRTIDVDVKDGTAIIPDELLQKAGDLRVYAFAGTAASGFTKVERVYNIVRRNKPNDYMYTPTEQKSLEGLQNQIGDLNDLETNAKDNLVAAINEANKSGGGGGEITSEDIKNALGYIPVNPFWVHATIVNYTNATIEESIDEIITAVADGKIVAMIAEFANDKNALQMTAIIPLTAIQGDKKIVQFAAMGETNYPITITIIMRANQSPKVQLSGIVTSIDDEVGDVTSNAVKFEPQSLSENEKAQARKNIGINPEDKISAMTNPVGVDGDGRLWSKADTSLAMTGATVGQIAKITAVDDSGKPTAWEAVDMPSGGGEREWALLNSGETQEVVKTISVDIDLQKINELLVFVRTHGSSESVDSHFYWGVGTSSTTFGISGSLHRSQWRLQALKLQKITGKRWFGTAEYGYIQKDQIDAGNVELTQVEGFKVLAGVENKIAFGVYYYGDTELVAGTAYQVWGR